MKTREIYKQFDIWFMSQCCEMNILRRREKCQIFSFLPLPTDQGSANFFNGSKRHQKNFLNQTKTVSIVVPVSPLNHQSFRIFFFN